jgi:hypothetical protein
MFVNDQNEMSNGYRGPSNDASYQDQLKAQLSTEPLV